MQVNLDILENSDDESTDEETARNTNVPLPQRQKRKPGRKTNKQVTTQPSECAEKDFDIESLKRAQSEDGTLSFIINLKRNGQEKPSWNESSDKSPETKFWELLEIKNDSLCLKWYYSQTHID